VLILAAAAAVVVALLRGGGGEQAAAPPLKQTPLSAEALVDSIGVSTHFNYLDTAYARRPEIVARIRELGIRHVRAAMPTPPVGPIADGLRELKAVGVRGTLGTGDPNVDPARAVADALAVMRGSIAAFEGPNELDHGADAMWPAKLRSYMPVLQAATRSQAPGIPLVGPSFSKIGNNRLGLTLPGMVNLHPYPGGKPPEPVFGAALEEVANGQGKGVVFTETGYHNAMNDTAAQPPVSEAVAAIYFPRLLVTAFGAGVKRTFVYELADERPDPALANPEEHFGLLRSDLSPKPAFLAIKTLIAALRLSPGPAPRSGGPDWEVHAPGDTDVERLRLVRRDGSQVIALWRPVSVWDTARLQPVEVPAERVEIRFARPARDIAVWRPSVAQAPVLRRALAPQLSLDLGPDLTLISLR
jgi:hypothetical protein